MITKIHKPHNQLGTTLRYNFKKVEEGEASVLYTRGLKFKEGEEPKYKETKKRMLDFLPDSYRTNNIVFHASINPHEEDKLSDAMMECFIDDYLEQLGYGSQPYIVFKHHDIDRVHYHVVSLNVDRNGRKIDDSYIKRRSWNILKELSDSYGIIPPNLHLKKGREELIQTPPKPIIYKEGNLAMRIKEVTQYAMELYKPKSLGELSALLFGYNIALEKIDKSKDDEAREGLVYGVIDEKGRRRNAGVNAADLGYFFLREQLEKQFKENKKAWKKERANRMKYAIAWSLRNTRDLTKFMANLEEKGIFAHLRMNEEGRIYGVTYIDYSRGVVCNGSDIGKVYSANALNDYFNCNGSHQWSINKERDEQIRRAISLSLHSNRNLIEFIMELQKRGVEVLIERDEAGRIANLIFSHEKSYVVTSSNEMEEHYSTQMFKNYFEEGGENVWENDTFNLENSQRILYVEKTSPTPQRTEDSLFEELVDAIGDRYDDKGAEAIGRMYQRQAERNWNRSRRRR